MAAVPEIDGYGDLDEVAHGGFATVYRATDARFDRVVALKVLDVADVSDQVLRRFERECRALGNLSWHPNVVAVHDAGRTADGRPYLAMEFLEAGTLADRVANEGPLAWPDAVRIGVQLAGALGTAHEAGVLHRDLKPENVLVARFGEVKLADFGIAAIEGASHTATGHVTFTVAHVAPEVVNGGRPDERSDLYSLASTLHTLVAGHPPLAGGEGDTMASRMGRVLHAPPPRLEGVPDDLADVVEQALAKAPEDRPQTAAAFGAALQDVQRRSGEPVTDLRLEAPEGGGIDRSVDEAADEEVPVGEAPVGEAPAPAGPPPARAATPDPEPTVHLDRGPAVPVATPSPSPMPPQVAEPRRDEPVAGGGRSRRGRGLAVAALVVVLVLALVGGVVLVRSGSDDDTDAAAIEATATVDVDGAPFNIAATGDAVWVTDFEGATVTRIDPETNEVVATVDAGVQTDTALFVAVSAEVVWVVARDGQVARIDPATNVATTVLQTEGSVDGVAASEDALWLAGGSPSGVVRVDPTTDEVVATIPIEGSPEGIAVTSDSVWVTETDAGTLSRIDPATNEVVDTFELGAGGEVAATDDAVWVTDRFGDDKDEVTRVDPTTGEVVATLSVDIPYGIAADDRSAFVATDHDGLLQIDAVTNDVVGRLDMGSTTSVSLAGRSGWVVDQSVGTVLRFAAG